jgi:oligopeptidase B
MADARPHTVRFGRVEGENRGPRPIDPPLEREDKYFWLRDDTRKDEAVLGHLRRERTFLDHKTRGVKGAAAALYDEHVARLKETDVTCPRRHGSFEYYTRTIKGLSYAVYCRRPRSSGRVVADVTDERGGEGGEEELLDVNKLAEGRSQCSVGGFDVSPTHKLSCFTVDFTGNEVYELRIRNASAGAHSAEVETISGVPLDGSFEWGPDDKTLYYTTRDETLRSFRVYRHVVGTPVESDELILEEPDEVWSVGCGKTLEGKHMIIASGSSESSEAYILDLTEATANDAAAEGKRKPLKELMRLVRPREFGLRYGVEGIAGDAVYITTNADACINNKVVRASLSGSLSDWSSVVVAHDPAVKIDGLTVLKKALVVDGRSEGLTQVWTKLPDAAGVFSLESPLRRIEPPEPIYDIGVGAHEEFDAATVRVVYSSLTTPPQTWEVDVTAEGQPHVVVKRKVVNGYDPTQYVAERRQAKSADGTLVDLSIVRRRDLDMSKPQPTLLYGYGSYGICIDPSFDQTSLAYIERGVVYCIAHIRGGGENGRAWYEKHGKYLTKRNTFHDFIAAAEHLVESGVTTPDQLAIEGRSAGGLLMGAVVNMRPDLFKVVVAGVPFVDVMTTMCDPSIPLTTGEWEEWGNPNEYKYFDYMLSYSPMDNVRRQPYPNILIVAGLHDPRVAYWEPAKWAVKLREHTTSKDREIVLKMDLEVGHFSASDRYKYLREKGFEQAYVLSKIAPSTITIEA